MRNPAVAGIVVGTQAMTRPSPVSLRKNGPTESPSRTGRIGPHRPANERAVRIRPPSEVVPRAPASSGVGSSSQRHDSDCARRATTDGLSVARPDATPACRRARTCPRSSARVLEHWAADKTFEASRRAARRRRERRQRVRLLRRPAVRQRPAALRPPAHRLRQGRGAALPDHARPAGRAPLRLGLPRPARRGGGREAARHHRPRPRSSSSGVDKFNEACRDLGAALHPGLGALRHPAGPLGRLRQRLQDPRPGLHGERHVGVQDPARQGPGLRGLPGAGVLLALRDAAVQHRDPDGRRLPRPAGPGADRVVRAAATSRRADRAVAGLDHHAVDAAVQPGARRRARTSSTRCCERGRRAGTCVGAARLGRVRQGAGGLRRRSARSPARDLVGRRYTPLFDFLVEQAGPNAFQVLGARLRHHRGRHRRRALAPGLRRGRPERLQRGRHPDRGHRRRPHPVHRAGAAVRRACRSSRRTSRSSATSRSAAWCCGTTPTPTRTRTAGAATPRWSTRRCRRGSSR